CLSHVIGLGNIVRFPYLAFKHGGGAFLVAYFILIFTCGLPLFIMETAIGQYSSLGPIRVWKAVPIFKGVGYSMVAISGLTSLYYGVISSWAMLYLVTSMTSVTPWKYCNNVWNTNCELYNFMSIFSFFLYVFVFPSVFSFLCPLIHLSFHLSLYVPVSLSLCRSLCLRSVVDTSDNWGEPKELRWQLSLCLVTAWAIVALMLIKGIKPGERVSVRAPTFEYQKDVSVCVSVCLSLCLSLYMFLFTPEWSDLGRCQLWRDAATQVFFSLSLGSGALVTMGTYNKFNNNLFAEAAIVSGVDSLLSVMASLVVFAVLGSIGNTTGQPVLAVARPDLGMPFVAFSEATVHLPGSLFWSGLSFLTLATCGVFTCASLAATTVTALVEVFSGTLKKQRVWFVVSLCSVATILGFTLMVQAGFNVVNVLDRYLSGLPQFFTSGLVVIAFAWVYGVNRFSGDVSRMINAEVGWWWRALWGCVTPCLLLILIIVSLASLLYGGTDPITEHPWFTCVIGMLPLVALQVPIIACACHEVSKSRSGILLEKIRRACKTRREWGATEKRRSSHVEYFPTVHTHMGIDISLDGLNTVTDRVEFSPVGVRVPSLSQTSLLPVSPGMRKANKGIKGGKLRDMRHTAILNHAYSNPQCNLSSGSLEKAEKKKFLTECPSEISQSDDVIFVKRKRKKVATAEASTQTDRRWNEPTLFRQKSQPSVRIPMPLLTPKEKGLTRSMSWHQLGQTTVLGLNITHFISWVRTGSASKAVKKTPAVYSNSDSSNSSKISNRISTASASCSKDSSSHTSDEIVPLEVFSSESVKKNKKRGTGTKMKTKLLADATNHNAAVCVAEAGQDVYVKPRPTKFNRSVSCDDAHVKIRSGSSSSSTSSGAKVGFPKQEKSKGMGKGSATEKKRRCGQSVPPNLKILMRQSSFPQEQLHAGALGGESYVMTSSSIVSGRKPLANKLGFRPDPSKLSGRMCADTVVRLSNGKSYNAEVCSLSGSRTCNGGIIQSKSGRQFPGSPPVETIVAASGKGKNHASSHNTFCFNECAVRATKPPLRRSESETAGGGRLPSEKSTIRPVVSQPSISGYTRIKAANGYKISPVTLPHTKRKRRSKSAEGCTPPEQETSDYHTTSSLPRGVRKSNSSTCLKQADSLSSRFGDAANMQRDNASIQWPTESSHEKVKQARAKIVYALPLSEKELLRNTSNQTTVQQVCWHGECNNRPRCEEMALPNNDPAIVDIVDDSVNPMPVISPCSTEEGNVILEETEIDLELDKDEHGLFVSSSLSLPSSLSSPSPSSTLLPPLDSVGYESTKL
ncbi:hypothetical protein EGW08_003563, partial [Elysia chlorotica]